MVDVVSSYIKVQKAGMNFKARCPFHNEKTPSFYISPERQIWHCFGCQKGGDIFGFVKEIEGVEFPEAMKILAQKAGIELERFDPGIKDEKTKLYEITEAAAKFFEKQLHFSNTGQKALAYLKNRGLNEETIKNFRLGFAPNDWESLTGFLRDCGYKEKEIVAAGMAIKREQSEAGEDKGAYDRFRSRIIFPIFDLNDRAVGFTGRVFQCDGQKSGAAEEPAKYINTPQTLIYDKSMVLYGLNKAKTEVRQSDKCLLVEGNMDALMSHQAGVKNVVATSGTALTQNHLKILQRYTNNLDFCFDTDQAGAIATRRGIGLALSQNLNINVVQIKDKECKDPADYVFKYKEGWQNVVANSKPVIEFYFDNLKSHINPSSVEGKKTVIAVLAPLIRRLVSRVEKSHWVAQLAFFLKTKEEAIEADIISAKDDLAIYERGPAGPRPVSVATPAILALANNQNKADSENLEIDILSEALLSLIIKNPSLFLPDLKNISPEFLCGKAGLILSKISEENCDSFVFSDLVKKFEGEDAMKIEFAYLRSQELWNDFKDEELKAEFFNLFKKIKQRAITTKLTALEYGIKEAEAANDKNKINELAAKFAGLACELAETQR